MTDTSKERYFDKFYPLPICVQRKSGACFVFSVVIEYVSMKNPLEERCHDTYCTIFSFFPDDRCAEC